MPFCGRVHRSRLPPSASRPRRFFRGVTCVGMEAVFPTGTLPMSAVATTVCPTTQARPHASHRLVDHALSAVAAEMGIGFDRLPGSVVSTNPVASYNPVVIVGPAGSGKSRLLAEWFVQHSHADETKRPAVVMWDGRSLVRELTAALSQNAIDRLHTRFVSSRLIIIDSVEQITAWDAQRALAHLFDAAIAAGSVFVATVRMHPMACPGLEPSLASRLAGGLVVSMPPIETTRYQCQTAGSDSHREVTVRRVINATARHYGLTAADLVGSSRCRQVSQARGLAMYLARRLTSRSLQSIGDAFGGRDHTTVMHGIRGTESRRSLDAGIAADIDRLIAALLRR